MFSKWYCCSMKLSQGRDIQKELAGNIVLVLESKLLNLSALSATHLAVGGWLCYSRLWKLSRNWPGWFAMTFSSATVVICQQFQVGVPLVIIGSSHLHKWICASFREPTSCTHCPGPVWWINVLPRHVPSSWRGRDNKMAICDLDTPKGWLLSGCCIFGPHENLT